MYKEYHPWDAEQSLTSPGLFQDNCQQAEVPGSVLASRTPT